MRALFNSQYRHQPRALTHPSSTYPFILCRGFDEDSGVVKLRMAGSCVGCPSSTATLRNGVENMLMHYIPEVRGIEQVQGPLEELGNKELKALEEKLEKDGSKE